MIKFTQITSDIKTNNYALIISGGPGLSSLTLRSLDLLKHSLNLVYVDFHGTNDVPYLEDATYEELVKALENKVLKEISSSANVFVIGHSFGGFFAASIAHLDLIKGIFCLAAPFSKETMKAVNECYAKNMTPSLSLAEKEFNEKQDNESFRKWLSEYGTMYFLNPKGRNLLLSDKVSAKFYLANTADISKADNILDEVTNLKKIKIFIAGKQDGLIPVESLEKDALRGKFKFFAIDNASHFITFDQPETVARLIEENIVTVK